MLAGTKQDDDEPRLVGVASAQKRLGIGRSLCWELIASGELPSVRIGRRRLVPVEAIDDYVRRLITDQRAS